MHTGDVMCAVDGDRASRPLEHRKTVGPPLISRAVDVGPVGAAGIPDTTAAIDRAVRDPLITVPELHGDTWRGDQQVDLIGLSGLQHQITPRHAARHRADQHAVVGQTAGVVHQAIHAAAKTADVTDVERAVEGQVVGDIDQRIAATGHRVTEAHVEVGVGIEHQRIHRQRAAGNAR